MASEAYKVVLNEYGDPRIEPPIPGWLGRTMTPDFTEQIVNTANFAHAAALRSLSSAAPLDLTQFDGITPGEWVMSHRGSGHFHIGADRERHTIVDTLYSTPLNEADARAIAAVPKLLAEVTRLRAVEAELRGEIEKKDRAILKAMPYMMTEKDILDHAQMNNGDASGFGVASRALRKALSPEVPRE